MKSNSDKRKIFLRIFSLVFSLLIWLYVISSAQVEVEKIVPLSVELPDGYATVSVIKKELSYMIKGPRVFVRTLLEKKNSIVITVKDYYKSGQKSYSLSLSKYQLALPLGVELVSSEPKKFDFKIEKKITRSVPISLSFDPEVIKSYEIKKTILKPTSIEVTGARSLVKKIKSINTTMVDTKMFSEGKDIKVELISPHENLELSEQSAMVNYTMASRLTEFTFTSIPIIFHSTKLVKAVLPKVVSVTLKGEKGLIKNFNKNLIKIVAQVPNTSSGKVSIDLQTELPDGVELIKLEPESITVFLE